MSWVAQPTGVAWCARRVVTACMAHAAGDGCPGLVDELGWQHKMEGVSRRAPDKGRRRWSSLSVGQRQDGGGGVVRRCSAAEEALRWSVVTCGNGSSGRFCFAARWR
jgi:hypothetical protein